MKTGAPTSNTWDDVIFENRHQGYGAYVLRKHYSENLVSGFLLSAGIAVSLVALPLIASMFGKDPATKNTPALTDSAVVKIIQPPVLERIQPPPTVPPPAPPDVSSLYVRVVDHDVDTDLPTVEHIAQSLEQHVDGEPGGVPTPVAGMVEAPEPAPVVEAPHVFERAEVMPTYEGGSEALYQFLRRKIRYPASARRTGIEGTVYVSFVIDAAGQVTDINVVRGISRDCDDEAARVIALLPKWKPGMQNHHPVAVRMTLPIAFKLAK